MNILVLNGSPKGENSITLYTSLYLQRCFPNHSFRFLHVGRDITRLEKDPSPAVSAISEADLLLFSYPVYTFLAPSQLHRFIALMKSCGMSVAGKYATQITTSKHFYDVTAHRYIRDNCMDMGLRFINGLSADMDDLTQEKGRADAVRFLRYVEHCVANRLYEPIPAPAPSPGHVPVPPAGSVPKKQGTVALVADLAPGDTRLRAIVDRFTAVLPYEVRLVDLHAFPFKGGCISCFHCAANGTCIYRDGFDTLLREQIQTCRAIVLAFTIQDHSMGPVFKTYDDRQFCNGHRTVTMGMPFGYLISGDYSREENLRMVIDGRAEVGGNFLAGVATDEFDPAGEIDRLAATLDYAIENRYTQPSNFLGVGGMKIFRDLIWLMQGMMKADHRFYKAHGQYDFPQKHRGRMLAMYLVGAMLGSKRLKSKLGSKMNEGMLAPYRKALDAATDPTRRS